MKLTALARTPRPRRLALALTALALCSCAALTPLAIAKSQHRVGRQLTWAPPGTRPLTDAKAAAPITRAPELRPGNTAANDYVPSNFDLRSFRSAKDSTSGETAVQENHWYAYVTGRDGLKNPSTDDLIQWAARKWGIPEDWLRALTAFESLWHQSWNGDLTRVPAGWYKSYPPQARAASGKVYESMGIAQIKWLPNGSINVGSGRLRWESTAFGLDYLGATIRFYYDGDCRWCGAGYHAGQTWASIGAWNAPNPWGNAKQRWYITKVKEDLAQRTWAQPGF